MWWCPLALCSAARANAQWALSEVWITSHPSFRSPTVGLRCSHIAVPGAEVFSISVPPPNRLNLKPPLPSPPPLLPFPLLCSGSLSQKCPSREQKMGGLGAAVSLVPNSGLAATPSSVSFGLPVPCQSMPPMSWKHPWLFTPTPSDV